MKKYNVKVHMEGRWKKTEWYTADAESADEAEGMVYGWLVSVANAAHDDSIDSIDVVGSEEADDVTE